MPTKPTSSPNQPPQPTDVIRIVGARENNLRNVSVDIPKKRITVFTGVSGSGKSSLVFDTIAAESQRQLNDTFSTYVRHRLPHHAQPDADGHYDERRNFDGQDLLYNWGEPWTLSRPFIDTHRSPFVAAPRPILAEHHSTKMCTSMRTHGFKILEAVLSQQEVEEILSALQGAGELTYLPDASSPIHSLLVHSDISRFASSPELLRLAEDALGVCPTPYQAVMLDKSRGANWELDWHQDSRIPVKVRVDTLGYTNWTLEAGIHHVVPPARVLASCITLRVHLDECDRYSGALEVAPGSHSRGLLNPTEIHAAARQQLSRFCELGSGGIMLMSPLLIHRSPPSQMEHPRRVLQINYQASPLENGLEWWGQGP